MPADLFIKYTGLDSNRTSDIDLKVLGESIQGFDSVLRKLVETLRIDSDVEIKATRASDGSIVIEILILLGERIQFLTPQDYLNFIQLVDPDLYSNLLTRWSELSHAHRMANDLVAENPVDFAFISYAIVKLFKLTKKQKPALDTTDEEGRQIPKRYATRMKRLIKDKAYHKAVKPFIEGETKKIEIGKDRSFKGAVEITESDFGEYLSEDERILPEWENGDIKNITGNIVSLQCSRGETLKFKVNGVARKYQLLIAYPPDGKTTQDFLEFYKQDVWIKAEILRKSLYQKPKIIIKDIGLVQSSL